MVLIFRKYSITEQCQEMLSPFGGWVASRIYHPPNNEDSDSEEEEEEEEETVPVEPSSSTESQEESRRSSEPLSSTESQIHMKVFVLASPDGLILDFEFYRYKDQVMSSVTRTNLRVKFFNTLTIENDTSLREVTIRAVAAVAQVVATWTALQNQANDTKKHQWNPFGWLTLHPVPPRRPPFHSLRNGRPCRRPKVYINPPPSRPGTVLIIGRPFTPPAAAWWGICYEGVDNLVAKVASTSLEEMEGKAKWRKLKRVVGPTSPATQQPPGKQQVRKEKTKTRDAKRRKMGEGDEEEEETETAMKVNGEHGKVTTKEGGLVDEGIPSFQDGTNGLSRGNGAIDSLYEANGDECQGKVQTPRVLVTDLDKDFEAATVECIQEPQTLGGIAKDEEFPGTGETGVASQTQGSESSVTTSSSKSDRKKHKKTSKKSGDTSNNDKPVKFFISDEESDSDTAIFVDANQPTPNGENHNVMDQMADGQDPGIEIRAEVDARGESTVELTFEGGDVELGIENVGESFDMSKNGGPTTTQLVDVDSTDEPHLYDIQRAKYKSSMKQPGRTETRKVKIQPKPETVSQSSTSESLDVDSVSKSSVSDLIDQESYSRTSTTETSRTSTVESQDADTVSISSVTESTEHETLSKVSTTESGDQETITISTTESTEGTSKTSTAESVGTISKSSTVGSMEGESKSSSSESGEQYMSKTSTSASVSKTTTSEYEEAESVSRTSASETASRTSGTSRTTTTTESGEPTGTSRTATESVTSASETGEYISKSISSSTDFDAESLSSTADLLTPKEEPPFPLGMKAEAEPGDQVKLDSSPEILLESQVEKPKDELEVLPGSPSWKKLDVEDQLRLASKTEIPEGMPADAMKDKKDADAESLFFSLYPEYQPGESQELKDEINAGNPKVLCFRGQTPDQGERHEEVYMAKEKEAGGKDGRIKGAVSGKIQQLQRKLSQQKKPERETKEILESEGSPPQLRSTAVIDQIGVSFDEQQATTPGNGDDTKGDFDRKEFPDHTTPGGPLPDVLDRSITTGTGIDTKEIQYSISSAKDDLVRTVGKLGERIEGLADSVEVVAGVVSDVVQNASGQADIGHEATAMTESGQEAIEGEGKSENNMKDRKTLVGKARDWIKGVARIGSKKEDSAEKAAEKEREAAKKAETPSENGTDETSSVKSKSSGTKETPNGEEKPPGTEEEGAVAEGQKMPGTPPKEDEISQISKEERISLIGDNGIPSITPEEITDDANHVSDRGSTNGNGKQDDFAAEEKPLGEEAAVVTLEEELMKAEDEIIQDISAEKGTGKISPIKEAGSPEKEIATAVHIETLGAEEEKPDSGPKEGETEQTERKEEQAEGEAKEEITDEQGKEAATESQEAAEGTGQAAVIEVVTEDVDASKEEKEREEAGKEEGAAEEPTKGKDELKPRRKRREKSKSPSVRRDREGKERKEKDKDKDKDGKGSIRKRRHRRRTKSQEEPGEPGLLQATEVIDAEAAQAEGIAVQPEISKESEIAKEAETVEVVHEPEVKQEVGFARETEIIGEAVGLQEPEISQEADKETEQKPETLEESAIVKQPEVVAEPIVIKEVDAKSAEEQKAEGVKEEAEAKEEPDISKEILDAQAEVEKMFEAHAAASETVADHTFKLEISETAAEVTAAALEQETKKEEAVDETTKKEEATEDITKKEAIKKEEGAEEKDVDKADSKEAELGTAKKVDSATKDEADEKKEKGLEADQAPGPEETPTTTRRRKDSARSHKDKFSDEFWKDKLSSGQKKHSFGSGDYSGVDIKRPSKFKREQSEEPKEEKQDTEESEKAAKSEEKPQEEETQGPQETPETGDQEAGEVQASVTASATSWSPRVSRRERKSSRRSGEHKRESRSTSKSKSSKEKKHQESEGVTTKAGEDAASLGSPKSLKKKKKKSEAPGSPKEGSAPEPKPRTRHSKPESPLTKKTPTTDQLAADSVPVLQELKFPEGISKPVSPSPVMQTLKFPEGISQPLSPTPEKVKPSVTIPKPTPEAQPLSPLKPLKFPEGISQPISPITQKVKPPPFKPTQETTKEEVIQPVSPTSKTAKSPEVLSPSPKELKFPEGVSMPRSPTPQELKFPEGVSKPLSPSPKELKFPVGVSKPLSPSPKELKFPEGISKPLSPAPRELKFPEGISKPLSPSPKEAKVPEPSPSPKELTFPEGISKPLSPSPKEVPKPFSPLPQELKFPEGVTKPLSPAIIAGKMPEPKPLKEKKKERPRVIIPKTLEPAIEPMKPISPMKTLKFPEGVTKPISPMKTRVVSDLKPSSPTSETKKPMSPLKPLKFPEGISKPISPLPPKATFKPVSSVAKPPSPTLDEAPKPVTSVDKATATEPLKTKASQTLTKLEFPEGVSIPVSPVPAKAKSLATKGKIDMKIEMQKKDLADAEMKKSETSLSEVSSPLLTALQFPEGISKPLSPVPPGPKPTEKKASTPDEPPTPPLPSTLPPDLPKGLADGSKPLFTTTAPETPPIQTLTFPEGVSVPISPIPKSVKPTTSSPLTKPSTLLQKVTSPQPKGTTTPTQKPASPKLSKKTEFPKSILSTKHRTDSVKSPDATSKPETDQVSSDAQPPASKPSPEEKPLTTGERISRAVASIGLTRSSEGRTTSKFSRSDSLRSSQKRTESQEGARPQQDDTHAKDGSESPHAGAESPSKRLRRRKKR
ncbi:titin-like [Penaeus chinensis]|uniref:titin-like n=1 Tax=Penaeus chinensis TaxID=139456 RepID=UPI001FB85CEE|nr:titin-like [Penaeus chinensis]